METKAKYTGWGDKYKDYEYEVFRDWEYGDGDWTYIISMPDGDEIDVVAFYTSDFGAADAAEEYIDTHLVEPKQGNQIESYEVTKNAYINCEGGTYELQTGDTIEILSNE